MQIVYWDNGEENGNCRDYRDHIGLYIGIIGSILGLYWDNGEENGNYYNGESNGKENGK